MFKNSRFLFLIYFLFTIQVTVSCGSQNEDSSIDALSSNDWFKDGVDRFYLAHLETQTKLDSDYDYTTGDHYTFGVGCYGEPSNPKELVEVAVSENASEKIKIPLNERTLLYQFPTVEAGKKPEKGQCEILYGSHYIAKTPDIGELETGGEGLRASYAHTALSCTALAAQIFTLATTTVLTKGAATGPVAAAFKYFGVTGAAWLCYYKATNLPSETADFQRAENKKLLADSYILNKKITQETMAEDGIWNTYKSFVDQKVRQQLALAMYSRSFVKTFNTKLNATFENGWGSGTKFFDAMKEVKGVMSPLGGFILSDDVSTINMFLDETLAN